MAELFAERYTWRRFLVLVRALPWDSAWQWWRNHKPLEGDEAAAYVARMGI